MSCHRKSKFNVPAFGNIKNAVAVTITLLYQVNSGSNNMVLINMLTEASHRGRPTEDWQCPKYSYNLNFPPL